MFQRLLEKIAVGLEKCSIDYMVIGGQAVLLYGEPRLTKDIDVTLGIGTEGLPRLSEMIRWAGWRILVESPDHFVQETMVLPCLDPESGIRIDFIFSFSPYEREAFGRVKTVLVGNAKIRFASPEDLIIHKMIAGRPRDLEDVYSILLKNAKVDFEYIQKWLVQFENTLDQPLGEKFRQIQKKVE